jgi:ABC-type spermidine/putrescine transport system permease subunit II
MSVNYQGKIITLWTTFLLGTIFHTDLGLMPLFHGQSVAHSHESGNISWVMWLMLAFFVLPMFAIIAPAFTESKRFRVAHFGLTVFYSVMNLLHVILDLFVTPIAWYQITLMVILFAIGLLLNVVSFQWMQHPPRGKRLQEQVSC